MKNLDKHFKAITKKDSIRTILRGVNYLDGKLTATDSYRLLVVEKKLPITNGATINFETMEEIEGNYPNTERVMPKNGSEATIDLNQNLKEIIAKLRKNKKELIKVKFSEDGIEFGTLIDRTYERLDVILAKNSDIVRGSEACFNGGYLLDLINFLKDYKVENKKKNSNEITVRYMSENRPLVVTDKNFFSYIITPVRID